MIAAPSFDAFATAIERVTNERTDMQRQLDAARMGLRLIAEKTDNVEIKAIAQAALKIANGTKP